MSAVDGNLYQTGYSGLTDTDISTFLKRTFTASEKVLVNNLITDLEDELCRATNRNFKVDDGADDPTLVQYYEYFTADFLKVMVQNSPVNSMVAIEVDGVDKTSLYTENVNYWIYDNYIVFSNTVVGTGYDLKSVKITYTIKKFWGRDVTLMLTKWVAYEFLKSENAGVGNSSMSFAEVAQTFDLNNFIKERDKVIFRYTDFEI